MNTFRFVGKIKVGENAVKIDDFDGGFRREIIRFSMECGDNVEYLDIIGRHWAPKNGEKEGFFNTTLDENKKPVWTKFNLEDENDEDKIKTVPYSKRKHITLANDKTLSDAEMKARGLKYVFINPYSFVKKLGEMLMANEFGEKKYVVTGSITYDFTTAKDGTQRYYRHFVPDNIVLAADEAEEGCWGSVDFYFIPREVVQEELENGDVPFSGFVSYYDEQARGTYYKPTTLTVEKDNPRLKGLKTILKRPGVKGEVMLTGLQVQFVTLYSTEEASDELSESEKELVAAGFSTIEQIKRSRQKAVGDRVKQVYILQPLDRYASIGTKETDIEVDTLYVKPVKAEKTQSKSTSTPPTMDIIDDDDDLRLI